jgi:diguanylate cyclase (GGDEF)-like protein
VERVARLLGPRLATLPSDADVIPLRRLAANASALVAVRGPSQTADSVVRSLCELTGMDSGALALLDDHGRHTVVAPCGPLQDALAATSSGDLRQIDQMLEPLTSCYSSGEATGLTFVGGGALRSAGACAVIALPLVAQGQRRGVVLLASTVPTALGPEITEPAELLATLAATCLENSRHVAELQALVHADALTGLGNHARFHHDLGEHGGGLTVLMFDIDRFKQVNDTNGHLAGDEVLSATARHMERAAGTAVRLYRVGGDEFAGLTDLVDPDAIAARIEAIVAAGRGVLAPNGADLSWGTATREAGEATLEVMARADADLYRRKRTTTAGRAGR